MTDQDKAPYIPYEVRRWETAGRTAFTDGLYDGWSADDVRAHVRSVLGGTDPNGWKLDAWMRGWHAGCADPGAYSPTVAMGPDGPVPTAQPPASPADSKPLFPSQAEKAAWDEAVNGPAEPEPGSAETTDVIEPDAVERMKARLDAHWRGVADKLARAVDMWAAGFDAIVAIVRTANHADEDGKLTLDAARALHKLAPAPLLIRRDVLELRPKLDKLVAALRAEHQQRSEPPAIPADAEPRKPVRARLSGGYVDIEQGLLGRRVGEAIEDEDGCWTFVPWPGAYEGETWRPVYRTAIDMLEAVAESWPKAPTIRFRAVKVYDLTVESVETPRKPGYDLDDGCASEPRPAADPDDPAEQLHHLTHVHAFSLRIHTNRGTIDFPGCTKWRWNQDDGRLNVFMPMPGRIDLRPATTGEPT